MDLWVVAAAAGAGYIAKNLQNLSVDKRESVVGSSYKYTYNIQSESRNFLQQLRERTCPLRRLARQRAQDDAFLDVENHSDVKFSDIDRVSSRDREAGVGVAEKAGILEGYNMGLNSSLPSGVSAEESLKFEDGENGSSNKVNRGKLVRSRKCRVHSVRPLNSVGSCLENMEHSACLCPSISTVRPVLVTDGTWGNSSSFTTFDGCVEEPRSLNGVGLKVTNARSSSSSLQFESVEEVRKPKKSSDNLQLRSSRSQGPDNMLLFITGMMVGIVSATMSWKNEVDKLNKQLKQMQNLVQDLHEELDTKEMLTVKELTDDGDLTSGKKDTPLSIQEPISSPSDEKNAENLELLSRIEAELQAELEMLEQNMKATALERLSSVVELDPNFEPDIVEGDLKPAMVKDASESENETTDTTTNCSKPANYAVSPWELSFRLHELIESRLETRINELEIALGDSHNRVQFQGSQSMVSGRGFSYSESESSSTHQSPKCICDEHDTREEEPSTNASKKPNGILDKDQEKEDGESGSNAVDQGKGSIDRVWSKEFESFAHYGVTIGDGSETMVQDMPEIWDKKMPMSFMSNEDSMSEEEGSDESDMLLIKQIVERRRSGSSLNLKID